MGYFNGPLTEYPPVEWDKMVLTEEQAAGYLGVSPTDLRREVSEGKIPRYLMGGTMPRYYVHDLLRYQRAMEREELYRAERETVLPRDERRRADKQRPATFASTNPHVYVIRCDVGGPAKIGISHNLAQRMREIQNHCPFALDVVAYIENGGPEVERELHFALDDWRTHGEWFFVSAEMARLVNGFVERARGASFSRLAH